MPETGSATRHHPHRRRQTWGQAMRWVGRQWHQRVWVAGLIEPLRFTGELVITAVQAVAGGWQVRRADLLRIVADSSAGALPIVVIVNALVGAILAFVGAVQLVQFGAGIFVADLVSIAVAREMAAVITAVVMAGRTGAAFAAELATMQVNEEVDALKVLGLDPVGYLALPRVLSLMWLLPLLYLFGTMAGVFGGVAVGAGMLSLSPVAYLDRAANAMDWRHLWLGLSKSVVFGGLLAWAGCYQGLRAQRDAAGVGLATTRAVVGSIVGVIVVDAVFAVCANALGV
jgi:phospholipid/cholesterol/gamma-HCH transport system permease protein